MEYVMIGSAVASVASSAAELFGGSSSASTGESEARLYEQEAEGFRAEAEQFADEAETARVNAVIEETERRRQLASVAATQDAIRAGRGLELDSGTSRAVREDDDLELQRDVNLIRLNSFNKQRQFRLAEGGAYRSAGGSLTRADMARARGSSARISSYARAGSGILSGAQTISKLL